MVDVAATLSSRNLRSLWSPWLSGGGLRRGERVFHKDCQGIASPRACLLPWKPTTTLLY